MKEITLYRPDGSGITYRRCNNIFITGDIIEFDYNEGHIRSNLKFIIS